MPAFKFERFPYKTKYTVREKLAIGFEYDEQIQTQLSGLEWDEYHCSWKPEYCFASDDRRVDDIGSWIADTDDDTLELLREEISIPVPQLDDIPLNLHPFRGAPSDENPNFNLKDGEFSTFMAVLNQSTIPARRLTDLTPNSEVKIPVYDHLERECPRCEKDGILSDREVKLVYRYSTDAMKILRDTPATHFCDKCDSLFIWPEDDDGEGSATSMMDEAMGR